MNKTYYSMEKWYLAELLLLLAENDAVNAAKNTEDDD